MAYKIFRINADTVTDFAAIELKKYLRMMMPRCGEIKVQFDPSADYGFRLGLMSEFGLDPEVEDVNLDDVIYIDADENGGIIAGSNHRSILLAVYRYLKLQGCNWLFPGPDGEKIPLVDSLKSAKLHHKASCRYRGQCNEGAETQPTMMDAIDFTPKVGLNIFMLEFDIPKYYYQRAYQHKYGNMPAEAPLSNTTILQWKRQCEVEMSKRGLQFHDMGHGWTAEPFGFDSTDGWVAVEGELPAEQARHLAMINGVRKFHKGIALNTNLCMSNPETRSIVANYIADYAEKQNNVDFLHVWLADATNNHCECEQCCKKVTSDWYVMMLNDIDEELTKRGLDTHIVFIAYVDTLWGPREETIKNEKRFTMLFAPISRKYTETYFEKPDMSQVMPYVRNKTHRVKGMAANLGHLMQWKEMWKGDCFCYEYHFWLAQYLDMGSMFLADIIHKDVRGLKQNGLRGIVEDGSQRSYFPTGFHFYVYGETLFDNSKTFDELKEEYFSAAFGDDWKQVTAYLESLSATSDFGFCKGERDGEGVEKYYDPSLKPAFEKTQKLAEEFLPTIEKHLDSDVRCQYVSWEVLKWHTQYVKYYSRALAALCTGDTENSSKNFYEMIKCMAPLENLRPTIYDHELAMSTLRRSLDMDNKVSYSDLFV